MEIIATLELCVCCTLAAANGDQEVHDECCDPSEPAPLSAVGNGYLVLGLENDDHCEGCIQDGYPADDCECGITSFTARRCDGCGSGLAGERHAAVILA